MGKRKKQDLVPRQSDSAFPVVLPTSRRGFFEEGIDKFGHHYEKKIDENGLYTKQEILNDGTRKMTIKQKP